MSSDQDPGLSQSQSNHQDSPSPEAAGKQPPPVASLYQRPGPASPNWVTRVTNPLRPQVAGLPTP